MCSPTSSRRLELAKLQNLSLHIMRSYRTRTDPRWVERRKDTAFPAALDGIIGVKQNTLRHLMFLAENAERRKYMLRALKREQGRQRPQRRGQWHQPSCARQRQCMSRKGWRPTKSQWRQQYQKAERYQKHQPHRRAERSQLRQ